MLKNKIKQHLKYLIALLLIGGLFNNTLLAQGNALIVPGEEVGVLKLGNPIGFITQDLGNIEPSSWHKEEDGTSSEMRLSYKDMGLTLVFDYGTKKLKKVVVVTPSLLVKGTGIHVGSKEVEVLEYFKDPSKEGKANELDYPQLGIKFVVKENDRTVCAIEIKEKITFLNSYSRLFLNPCGLSMARERRGSASDREICRQIQENE